jgi:membrane associated rhomboid family serine protease
MLILPFHVDVPMYRYPISNMVLIGLISLISIAAMFQGPLIDHPLILDGWGLQGMIGSMFLHAGPIHLIGNMIFLWVFGNAVCAKVGNLAYAGLFLLLGLLASAAHLIMSGAPAVGASGALNGIVGMFLLFYPLNNIRCLFIFLVYVRTFRLSSMWMILLWLLFDIWGALGGGGSTAYWAHLGGFAAGAGLAALGLTTGYVKMLRTERSLIAVIQGETT